MVVVNPSLAVGSEGGEVTEHSFRVGIDGPTFVSVQQCICGEAVEFVGVELGSPKPVV